MKINLHTIAKRISSSKEMKKKKKKLEIKKRKWKNKTKQKKNKITTTQWASDIHWTSRGRLIPTGLLCNTLLPRFVILKSCLVL